MLHETWGQASSCFDQRLEDIGATMEFAWWLVDAPVLVPYNEPERIWIRSWFCIGFVCFAIYLWAVDQIKSKSESLPRWNWVSIRRNVELIATNSSLRYCLRQQTCHVDMWSYHYSHELYTTPYCWLIEYVVCFDLILLSTSSFLYVGIKPLLL